MSKLDRIMSKMDERMAKVRAEFFYLDATLSSTSPEVTTFHKKLAKYAISKVRAKYTRMQRARKQLYKQLKDDND